MNKLGMSEGVETIKTIDSIKQFVLPNIGTQLEIAFDNNTSCMSREHSWDYYDFPLIKTTATHNQIAGK